MKFKTIALTAVAATAITTTAFASDVAISVNGATTVDGISLKAEPLLLLKSLLLLWVQPPQWMLKLKL